MKASVIQMASIRDVKKNVAVAKALMQRAVEQERPDWVLLPEHFHWAGGTAAERIASAEIFGEGPAYSMCREFARANSIYVHAGSIYERLPGEPRYYNTSVVFDRAGNEVARYRKVHLFDITAPDGTEYRESHTVSQGDKIVVYEADGIKIGCAICYDLRFPELFTALVDKGAQLIALPAAFTLQTGRDHWEPLIRARAIETQTYMLAAGACGETQVDGKSLATYGHSMIVDPWGLVVAMASDGAGMVSARIDLELLSRIRRGIPLADHRIVNRATNA